MFPTLALPKSGYIGRSWITSSQPAHQLPVCSLSVSSLKSLVNPFIQSKRLIIRIHAEAINHVARNMADAALNIRYNGLPGKLLELLQKPLIPGIVDMAVKHVGLRIPRLIQAVLAIVKHNGVMTQNYLPPVIRQFLVGLNPFETACIHMLVGEKPVMIPLNQTENPV